jgi:hypothetical protein
MKRKARAPKGAPNKAAPKGPTPRRKLQKSPQRLIIADIQEAMDAIWKARKRT